MARMHGRGRGISSSALPYRRTAPVWNRTSEATVINLIKTFARKGLPPSQIGVKLRDTCSVPRTKTLTNSQICRILKANGLAPEIPEDLHFLLKKAHRMCKHLEHSRKDKDSKNRLVRIESRIHRLSRYYKRTARLPPKWKYTQAFALSGAM